MHPDDTSCCCWYCSASAQRTEYSSPNAMATATMKGPKARTEEAPSLISSVARGISPCRHSHRCICA